MSDTAGNIKRKMIQMISQRTPVERLKMVSSMFNTGKKLIEAGLLKENHLLNDKQLRTRTFLRLYGDSFTREEIEIIVKRIPNMQLDTYPD